MAAKLKKRALAEYNSQVVHVDPQLQEKRLKITGGDSRYELKCVTYCTGGTGQLPIHIRSHCHEIFQSETPNFHRSVSCDSSASAGGNVDNVVGGPIATAVSALNRLLNNGPDVQSHDKDATPGTSSIDFSSCNAAWSP